jgi:hypothetical protein
VSKNIASLEVLTLFIIPDSTFPKSNASCLAPQISRSFLFVFILAQLFILISLASKEIQAKFKLIKTETTSKLQQELAIMQSLGSKAEIQAFNSEDIAFLTKIFIPWKLTHQSWL